MLDLLFFVLLISILIQCYVCVKKVNITQPIEWGLENPEQPIREVGKLGNIPRHLMSLTLIGQKLAAKVKQRKRAD